MNIKFDVYNKDCPSRNILAAIGDKWSILIILKLSQSTYRFGELKRDIGGISPKVLTQSLQKLEQLGFIQRTEYHEIILRVEYCLTALGRSLAPILKQLTDWTEQHMDDLLVSNLKPQFECTEP
ncbi:winged helix-turn-helix transcriptional regulator [Legionella waltersii]|uniref:Putative transcriptional regulator n=1 Tax=Legionella waltersii TaxID=66969 RepID=A0A0W1AD10_9GAMM|nr:helix-turn-helix domain-containing protein [Legionella waltersii]KTD79222.1 putative transcriptional regulator [Legionella waltersii]SNV12603.1 putative transcriptional regulator [Legionella waltersii]